MMANFPRIVADLEHQAHPSELLLGYPNMDDDFIFHNSVAARKGNAA
jgi:hypothetical protein